MVPARSVDTRSQSSLLVPTRRNIVANVMYGARIAFAALCKRLLATEGAACMHASFPVRVHVIYDVVCTRFILVPLLHMMILALRVPDYDSGIKELEAADRSLAS